MLPLGTQERSLEDHGERDVGLCPGGRMPPAGGSASCLAIDS